MIPQKDNKYSIEYQAWNEEGEADSVNSYKGVAIHDGDTCEGPDGDILYWFYNLEKSEDTIWADGAWFSVNDISNTLT